MIDTVKCLFCEEVSEYYRKPSHKPKIYCNKTCLEAYRKQFGCPHLKKPEQDRTCCWCGSGFHAKKLKSTQRFCSNKCRGAWQSSLPYDAWKKKISENTANRPRGKDNPMWGKAPKHGKWHDFEHADGSILRLRSHWELVIASYLKHKGINFQYESKRFVLKDRTYLPDFFLPDFGVYWEVKGWMSDKAKETISQFREYNHDLPLIVVGLGMIKGFAKEMNVKVRL